LSGVDGTHERPAVAAHPAGGFVVVWTATDEDSEALSVVARLIAADAEPLSTTVVATQSQADGAFGDPDVTFLRDESFAVSWTDAGDVYGQRLTRRSDARCMGRPVTVQGTAASERLAGTAGDDVIRGKGGADTIKGLSGDDLICGGSGDDVLVGGTGADTLIGGPGFDVCRGREADQVDASCE
jgi:Ca2+-binding RTX toxin-like protein